MRPNHGNKIQENLSMASIESSMCPSQITRLVLGYLKDQGLIKTARKFCRESPYLTEHDRDFVNIDVKSVDKNRSLMDIIREFIEIREVVDEFYDAEWNRYSPNIPNDLLRARSLKDKILYACRMFGTPGGSSSSQRTAKRKHSLDTYVQTEYSDSSDSSDSVKATNVQDLPGYRPPLKRRKIKIDPKLIIKSYKNSQDVELSRESENDDQREIALENSDPMTQKQVVIQQFSESIINNAELIAMKINEANRKNPSEIKADAVGFDEMLANLLEIDSADGSSPSTSKPSSEYQFDPNSNRQLDTPVPKDANRSGRYELRSQRKSDASNELKESTNSDKIEILSNELVSNPIPRDEIQNLCNGQIAIVSESDEKIVSTTSNQLFQQPQAQPAYYGYMVDNKIYICVPNGVSYQDSAVSTLSNVNSISDATQCIQIDPSAVIDLEGNIVLNSNIIQSNPEPEMNERMIIVDKDEVAKEGVLPAQTVPQQKIETNSEAERNNVNEMQSNVLSLVPLIQIEQKNVTPKQHIKPNTSKSLSTPRHVRVLDFNQTPRYLAGIPETKLESLASISKYLAETPKNCSIVSSMPSSAPPKVNSIVQSEKKSAEIIIDLDAPETFVPINEDTVISADNETPKVRKANRKSCVRSISAHKELDAAANEKRLKRVAKTKKKICPDDGDSNEEKDEKVKKDTETISTEDAASEWEKLKLARNNPALFEQNLREQNSKKTVPPSAKKRRNRKKPAKKNSNAKTKSAGASALLDESIKSVDLSLNSSIDLNASTNLEARMLEENLRSAKKATPIKQEIVPKSAKKKTPMGKLQIKLMPSPKNKTLKRLKSKKDLAAKQTIEKPTEIEPIASGSGIGKSTATQSEVVKSIETKPATECSKQNENTTDELKVAQDLISLKEVILKQADEKKKAQNTVIQSDSVSMSNTVEAYVPKPQAVPSSVIDPELLKTLNLQNNSTFENMSLLLETPLKDDGSRNLPKTPGFILPHLVTPMLRPSEHLLDDSIFKNPNFPTPNFPITPGSIFTPFKDILTPKSTEIIYGAPNRPTDYSSSSSYYKPDESDGIDLKQIQASVHSNRTTSGVYSADELNDDSRVDESQNTLNSSSSSSSSSSDDSDSDTDSDSSSSSDSEPSQVMNKSETEVQPTEENTNDNVKVAPPELIKEDSTQIIKSHLVSTNEVNIAQNILLDVPEEPVKNEEAERNIVLEEKRRRTQELLREAEMKKHEKVKPTQFKRYRQLAVARHEPFRPPNVSPSKRKSKQPKKIQRNAQSVQSQANKTSAKSEAKMQTERLITEAASDNAVIDASDVTTTHNPIASPKSEEESVEAITSHLNKTKETTDIAVSVKEAGAGGSKKMSPESLVEMLSAKQKRFDANRPKMKTEVIAPLPLGRSTRSRTKIRPVQNILTKPPILTSSTTKVATKVADFSKEKSKDDKSKEEKALVPEKSTVEKSKDQKSKGDKSKEEKPLVPEKSEKSIPKSTKTESSKSEPSKLDEMPAEEKSKFVTPAKERRLRQIQDIFGDCTDLETPVKISPNKVNQLEVSFTPPTPQPQASRTKLQEHESKSTKVEADSSNVKDEDNDDDEDDESDSDDSDDDDGYEMSLSIDESDNKRCFTIRENASIKPKPIEQNLSIQTKNVHLEGMRIRLAASEEMELYTQTVEGVVSEMNRNSGRRSMKKTPAESSEAISSSEAIYGKPLHTSTPSPSKSVTAKFNIKHKSAGSMSPKSSKNQSKDDILGLQMTIEDVLVQLHPTAK